MNKNIIIAAMLVILAVAVAVALCAVPDAAPTKLVGKAVWYIPYAAIVAAVKVLAQISRISTKA